MRDVASGEPSRARNRRGLGWKLRDEILAAAVGILEESGREEGLTLRAVARKAGISPPAIYAHFADREAILAAVIADAFDELAAALTTPAIEDASDPVDRLRAGCSAYLDFAVERPQRYRVLFQNRRPASLERGVPVEQMVGYAAFSILTERIRACAKAGRSQSIDPFADATALWVALHGYATLHAAVPNFPWPPREEIIERIVLPLARIDA